MRKKLLNKRVIILRFLKAHNNITNVIEYICQIVNV